MEVKFLTKPISAPGASDVRYMGGRLTYYGAVEIVEPAPATISSIIKTNDVVGLKCYQGGLPFLAQVCCVVVEASLPALWHTMCGRMSVRSSVFPAFVYGLAAFLAACPSSPGRLTEMLNCCEMLKINQATRESGLRHSSMGHRGGFMGRFDSAHFCTQGYISCVSPWSRLVSPYQKNSKHIRVSGRFSFFIQQRSTPQCADVLQFAHTSSRALGPSASFVSALTYTTFCLMVWNRLSPALNTFSPQPIIPPRIPHDAK